MKANIFLHFFKIMKKDLLIFVRFYELLANVVKNYNNVISIGDSKKLVDSMRTELDLVETSVPEVAKFKDVVKQNILSGFSIQKCIWVGLANLNKIYPKEVCINKFENLCSGVSLFSKFSGQGEQFYVDRKRVRMVFQQEKKDGVVNPGEGVDEEIGVEAPYQWFMRLVANITPNSVDCERCFSVLTRLRSKFRRKLERHLPTLLRCSLSLPPGDEIYKNDFLLRILRRWKEIDRRNKGRGGGAPKKPRLNDELKAELSDEDKVENESKIQRKAKIAAREEV